MPLLNYTTTVEAAKTVFQIQAILQTHGARSVLINYDAQGQIEALSFLVKTPQGEIPIKLPVNPDAVLALLERAWRAGRIRKRIDRSQAIRIAWRIVKDWVEAQMAILETEMVRMEQIFLPYVQTPDGRTVYERLEGAKFLQLNQGVNEIEEVERRL